MEHLLTVVLLGAIIAVGAITLGAIGGLIILEMRRHTPYRGRHF